MPAKAQAKARERREELVHRLGLEPWLDRRAGHVSGGTQQRLALAGALTHEPRLLFLDEPTAGIDPVALRYLWDLLFGLAAEGITLIVTTHYMDEAERCGRVGYLHAGELLACGTPGELKRMPSLFPPDTRHLEFLGPDIAGLLERLRGRPGIREATIFGQAVHAFVDSEYTAVDLDLDEMEVHPTEPSLEDVFVALTRRREAERNASAAQG